MHKQTRALLAKPVGLGAKELDALTVPKIRDLPGPIMGGHGFGIVGPVGTGKTWGLVQGLAEGLDRHVCSQICPESAVVPCNNFAKWLNWPTMAEELKHMAGLRYFSEIAEICERWSSCKLLFVDDLGREAVSGPGDVSHRSLLEVLRERHRGKMPVFWTSNLSLVELKTIYGADLISRIMEAWPPVFWTGEDMRLEAARRARAQVQT
jgi:DNA replication protein DnaC